MIRTYQPEDAHYIIQSHYQLYNQEFGYDLSFKAFIKSNVEDLMARACPEENIWVVEKEGRPMGSIAIRRVDSDTSQLGLFLLNPMLRGQGYGHALLDISVQFCLQSDKKQIILYTNDELVAARHLYTQHGFTIKKTWKSTKSNKEMNEEMWVKSL